MSLYTGARSTFCGAGIAKGETLVLVDGRPLELRLDLCNHSPTGFEWGYGGSGPAQLALAILAHHFSVEEHSGWAPEVARGKESPEAKALALHQEFKWSWVFFFGPTWEMTSAQIEAWVQRKRGQINGGYDARKS